MDKLLVFIAGSFGLILTYWFFFMKKEDVIDVSESVDITVNGGYTPQVISVQKGKSIILRFRRTDDNSCLEDVVLSDFRIRKHLPLNKTVSIVITPQKTGEFIYSCGMNMFHGKIRVE